MTIVSKTIDDLLRQAKPEETRNANVRFELQVGLLARDDFADIVAFAHVANCKFEYHLITGWVTRRYLINMTGPWKTITRVLREIEQLNPEGNYQ
jgi:adenine deaminase